MAGEVSKYGLEKRRVLSPRERLAMFEKHRGICCLCEAKITVADKWIVEHIIALELGGGNEDANLGPAHAKCAKMKTREDHRIGAKLKRVRQKHLGIRDEKKRPMPGSRASKWKKKLDGTVVLRRDYHEDDN